MVPSTIWNTEIYFPRKYTMKQLGCIAVTGVSHSAAPCISLQQQQQKKRVKRMDSINFWCHALMSVPHNVEQLIIFWLFS